MTPEHQGVVVVSGASSGFGARTATVLARAGYAVVAIARRRERLEALSQENPDLQIYPMPVDIRDRDALSQAFDRLPDAYQDVAAVVNNAGLSKGFGPLQEGRSHLWREMIDTNVTGLLNVTEILLPRLIERHSGHVVNIGSIAAEYPYLGGNVYAATKAFVHQLSLNMRVDLQGTGVRVTCIAPGMARTEFALVRYDGDVEREEALYRGTTPLSANDVAEAVVWSLSRPAHVNINIIEIMPSDQPFGLELARTPPERTSRTHHEPIASDGRALHKEIVE